MGTDEEQKDEYDEYLVANYPRIVSGWTNPGYQRKFSGRNFRVTDF